MKVMGKHYRTVWMEDDKVFLIEQNKLPFKFEIFSSNDYHKTCDAIKNMLVRGAGAIGTTAGFAMAQAFLQAPKNNWENFVQNAKKEIESTRPTAQNLFYATDKVYNAAINSPTPIQAAQAAAQNISDEDIAACEKIGELGNTLINNKANILTHCNAGWLAFTDFGSALSPIYKADASGKDIFVYVDETRPRSQGARLTAWELQQQNIAHKIIPDNAAAYFMQNKKIDLIITGADRIAANGDTANKIGTLEKAICAKAFGIPFYIAAPSSTIDIKCSSGKNIPIEFRSDEELLYQTGIDKFGKSHTIRVCSPESEGINPAFDVTPAEYITAIITEKGIFKPEEIENVFKQEN